jgi:hypothetical protein
MPLNDDILLGRHQREEARWLILRVLYMSHPVQASEAIILRTLSSVELPVTTANIRRELSYLEDKGLLAVVSKKQSNWQSRITAYGMDVVEYAKDAPAGIARPDEA